MPDADPLPRWIAPALIVVLAVLGGLAGILAGRAWLSPNTAVSTPSEPTQAPELTLDDLEGQPQRLDSLRGQPVLVNFWATWCPPCVKELPLLQDLHERRDGDGLQVLTIAQEDDPAAVQAFLAQHGVSLPAWIDPPSAGDAAYRFGNTRSVLPYSVLIDGDGRILKRKAGAFSERELQQWARLAREPEA